MSASPFSLGISFDMVVCVHPTFCTQEASLLLGCSNYAQNTTPLCPKSPCFPPTDMGSMMYYCTTVTVHAISRWTMTCIFAEIAPYYF